MLHEHTRPDRDTYIMVLLNNTINGTQSQFELVPDAETFGTPYDYGSVMHYGALVSRPILIDIFVHPHIG